ncbi:iron-sulfur cluster-binding protein [Aspergillus heteromorphus CBS 117.55]|uniref:Iron-sulfur cluster-binding protein n=1 Tax=Aspergillus heteromorphus CBS 117.55 TaxID=1448321 RepID=A0A317VEC4_9EURO|nr:iron-sulfur cluster-binding protein [Aspergillus heteromorphus CBS 117.55]PWY72315.1 iron-sulfur cluster-binding protein [Aspergillus heteromorphus CBS 117.55]
MVITFDKEMLSLALPPAIAVFVPVVLLAGLALLFQAWSRPLLNASLHEENEANVVAKESDFPADWWVGSNLFELEKRAIFSKRWLYLSHRSRFSKAGDYHSYEVADIPIFLILGKDGVVRAFHNVCRHRAYAVTRKECGSSLVLRCRYHGWSFNTYGQLVKAPHFDHVPGFDKSQNDLFAIHTTTTNSGFILVNLDASTIAPPLETWPLDSLASRHGLGRRSSWVGGQTIEGQFNWKMCLRPRKFLGGEAWEHAPPKRSYMLLLSRLFNKIPNYPEDIIVFPFTTIHTLKRTTYWYSLSFIPISEKRTSIRFDLHCTRDSSSPNHLIILEGLIGLVNKSSRALEAEYQSYTDDSKSATAVSAFDTSTENTQKEILGLLQAHAKLEKQQGTEVFPAMRQPRQNARYEQAEQLCKELDCQDALNRQSLAW